MTPGEIREDTARDLQNIFFTYEDGTTVEDIIPILIKHEKAMAETEKAPLLIPQTEYEGESDETHTLG